MIEQEYLKIKRQLDDIRNNQNELRTQECDLQIKLYEHQQEKLRCLVGKAFKDKKKFYFVTGVPELELTNIAYPHYSFNPYQLPAYVIFNGKSSFCIQQHTLFSKAVDSDDPLKTIKEEYEEITVEKFENIAKGCINNLIHGIYSNGVRG